MNTTQWKLSDTLRRYRKSALALARASGLAKTTVYNILHNKSKAVELETWANCWRALRPLPENI